MAETDVKIIDLSEFIEIPVIPLRGLVVFPGMNLHFDVGRKKSIAALKAAMDKDQKIFLAAQKDSSVSDPRLADIYDIGVICHIKQMIKIPNSSNLRVIVEGVKRASIITVFQEKPYLMSVADILDTGEYKATPKDIAYARALKKEFEEYASMIGKISGEVISKIISLNEISELSDFICANTFFDYSDKQKILDEINPHKRIKQLLVMLRNENVTLEMEAEIHQEKVQKEIDKNQKEYFLREEMKVISDQLGEGEDPVQEADEYKNRINALKCSDEIKEKLLKECVEGMIKFNWNNTKRRNNALSWS